MLFPYLIMGIMISHSKVYQNQPRASNTVINHRAARRRVTRKSAKPCNNTASHPFCDTSPSTRIQMQIYRHSYLTSKHARTRDSGVVAGANCKQQIAHTRTYFGWWLGGWCAGRQCKHRRRARLGFTAGRRQNRHHNQTRREITYSYVQVICNRVRLRTCAV